jgi:hypothetical protein
VEYDAFPSYAHDSDRIATALHEGLQRFAKPWWHRRPQGLLGSDCALGEPRPLELTDVPYSHLLDAAAFMWTARRISARAGMRVPLDPEWDGEGLRMEIIR